MSEPATAPDQPLPSSLPETATSTETEAVLDRAPEGFDPAAHH
ncbi:hypothetical protein ACFQ8C_34380 [Streptomyces sp. NPDC056503]